MPTPSKAAATRRGLLTAAAAIGGSAALGLPGARATSGARPHRAVTVILGGRVFSGLPRDPGHSAVAIGRDGTILEVGSNADVRRLIGPGTEVIEAAGGTIMAGIHDGHMHPLGAALASLNPSLRNAEMTIPELRAAVQGMLDATRDREPDGWLEVTDWNPVGLKPAGTVADRSILDALSTSRPIALQGSDFHNMLVNSRALAMAGIDKNTPNPSGGEIVRDGDGNPTGLLKDSAQQLVGSKIPGPTDAEAQAAYADMAAFLLANGITSFLDAASGEDGLKTYRRLIAAGSLRQHVTPALVIGSELATRPARAAAYLGDLRSRFGGVPNLHLTTAKVFLDGVMEFPAQTAAMLSPYLDENGSPSDNYGDLYVKGPAFGTLAAELDRRDWQLHAHAIGDRAVRVALDGYAMAREANGDRGLRHTIAHLELVHPSDYGRFAELGVVASMQLQWALRNVFTLASLQPYIGQERFRRLYPAASLARAGAVLAGGSDWPVDPLRPFTQISTAVDRTGPDNDRPPLGIDEALTRAQSLRMHTAGSAYQLHSRRSGTVAPGKRADLIVLDRDLMRGSSSGMSRAKVQHTLIDGEIVYDAGSQSQRQSVDRFAAAHAFARSTDPHGRHADCCQGGQQSDPPA
jgi:predicted amidohydrolase YtcJ